MSTIVTRTAKGVALTFDEMDANFTNINADKAEVAAANTYTKPQRTSISAGNNAIDFTLNNNFIITATATTITALDTTGCIGQSGIIIINLAENVTGWDANFNFKEVPIDLAGKEVFAYFISDATTIEIGRVQ